MTCSSSTSLIGIQDVPNRTSAIASKKERKRNEGNTKGRKEGVTNGMKEGQLCKIRKKNSTC